jgi:hypothetical protein
VDIDKTLQTRGGRYGDFREHARVTQAIKRAMAAAPNWPRLTDDKREALEMVAHKIGRILNGDPEYRDSWHDGIGYLRLIEQHLEAEQHAQQPEVSTQLQTRVRNRKSARRK